MDLEFACDTGDKCWHIYKEFVKHEEGEFNLPLLNKASQAAYKLSCLTKVCNRMKSGPLAEAFERVVETKGNYQEALTNKSGKFKGLTHGEKKLLVLEAGGAYAAAVRHFNEKTAEYRKYLALERLAQSEFSTARKELVNHGSFAYNV